MRRQTRVSGQTIRPKPEPGMVTAEFALVAPMYFLAALAMIAALVGGWKTIVVANEAKEIAREYAIDGSTQIATDVERAGGEVTIETEGGVVHVVVRREGTGVYDLVGVDFVGQHRSVIEPGGARWIGGQGC
ncbi:hypothetical protein [Trueperella bialowiezensis]|uniref:TadE-like protein n=1 Tax=Trueperella bialowiezensis TaxID=312285 RepID=A0A3S4VT54_9ACTO|nr:hypothetical protein [Trueperella bialowiezensis]VEI13152.1 Uncharacterised protein [Trueperella bialowiezensis]